MKAGVITSSAAGALASRVQCPSPSRSSDEGLMLRFNPAWYIARLSLLSRPRGIEDSKDVSF